MFYKIWPLTQDKEQLKINQISQSLLPWFGFLRTSSRSGRCSLVSVSIFHAFVLLNTSSYSAHSWLVFVSIFLPLFCSKPRVALLAVDMSPSQSLPLWFAQNLELICWLLTCLDSRDSLFQTFVLCVKISTRSACCSVVSGGYLNTLTFVGLVLVSSRFIHPSFWVFNLFLIALNSVSV